MEVPRGLGLGSSLMVVAPLVIMILVEWLQREKEHGLDFTNRKIPSYVRIIIYYALIAIIMLYGANEQKFIYFQF
jgi:uncharacterized BrkB/YihY/UPF0761 family membrane protein